MQVYFYFWQARVVPWLECAATLAYLRLELGSLVCLLHPTTHRFSMSLMLYCFSFFPVFACAFGCFGPPRVVRCASSLAFKFLTINPSGGQHHKPFRFEAMWLKDPRCDKVVPDLWQEGLNKPGGYQFNNCIDRCNERLKVWNKVEFRHVGRKIAGLPKK